jgi:CRISPR-associated endonuclease Csn1
MGKKADVEKFSKFLLKILEGISVDEQDKVVYDDMIERLTLRLFLPKQKNTDNRVIPHQLYEYELKSILKNNS